MKACSELECKAAPFQILTQARLQLQMPAARAHFIKYSPKEIF